MTRKQHRGKPLTPTVSTRRARRVPPLGLAAAAVAFLLGSGTGGHGASNDPPAALDARFRAALRSPFAARHALKPGPDGTVACFVEGTVAPGALERLGARTGRPAGTLRTARIPATRLLDAARLPGVRRLSPALPMTPQLDLSGNDTRATLVRQGTPDTGVGVQGYGALVGVIDSGIDWSHADFKKSGGQTRIRAIWDQMDPIGPPPAGYTLGTAWTQAQIDMGTCRERDSTYYGHGTHVGGIAAGSGRATGNGWPQFTFVGVAPRADIIAVNTTFDDVDIADGIAWIFDQATALGRPAVINLSLGSDYGPHDGSNDLDQYINGISGPGRIVVASAGNSNGKGRHGERIVPSMGEGILSFRVFGYTPSVSYPDGISVDLWYPGGDNNLVTVRTPNGFSVGPVAKGAQLSQATPDGWVMIDATRTEASHANGDVEILVEISDAMGTPPASGDFELRFARVSGAPNSEVDGWIYDWSLPFPPAFVNGKEEAELIISPATADSAICVGAHTTRASWQAINGNTYNYGQTLNQIGNFSSPGPRRDGVIKPDLSAPGTAIGATHSITSLPNPTANILPDGLHKILQGTSMSAPQVTGTAALLLSRWPSLSATQVRAALMQSARPDGFTGVVPNNTWGAGKLDIEVLFRQRQAFTTTIDPPRAAHPGNTVGLFELCATPSGGTWSTKYRVRAWDSQGWLRWSNGGPSVAVALYDTVTATAFPGQGRCAPISGLLTIEIPPLATNGTFTTVTFQAEPLGLPWMAVTRTTTVTVSTTADATDNAPPARLALSGRADADGRTALELAVPTAGPGRLEAFDVAGRRRAVLLDGRLEAGFTEVPWDGTDEAGRRLASGVYLVRLVTPDGTAATRVVLTPR